MLFLCMLARFSGKSEYAQFELYPLCTCLLAITNVSLDQFHYCALVY